MLAKASLSSLRGWNLQFSGWRLIRRMEIEHKGLVFCCFFRVFFFLKQFAVVFFSLHYLYKVVCGVEV